MIKSFLQERYVNFNITQILNYLIIAYAFTIPFSKELNKAVAFLLLLVWIIDGDFKRKLVSILDNRVITVFILFVLYSYLSILWSDHTQSAIYYVNRYWYYFSIIVIFTSIDEKTISRSLKAFMLAMFISELITYGIYLNLWTTAYNETVKTGFPTAFMGHTAYSLFVAFTMMFTLNKLFFSKKEESILKVFYLFLFLLTFGNLLISGGRTGLLVLAATAIVFVVQYRKNMKYMLLVLSVISLLFVLGYKNITLFEKRIDVGVNDIYKVIDREDYATSWGQRVGLIKLGINIAKDYPIFGVGIKDNIAMRTEYALADKDSGMLHFSKWAPKTHFHNEYIEILTSIGLVGLGLFLFFLYSLFKIKIDDIEYKNIKFIFITVLIFGITTSAMFHHRQPIALFAFFIAILLAKQKFEQEKSKK